MGLRELAQGLLAPAGQGLKLAGGAFSPQVFQANINQEAQASSQNFQREQLDTTLNSQRNEMIAGVIIKAVQNQAMDPQKGQELLAKIGYGNIQGLKPPPPDEVAMLKASLSNEELQRRIEKDKSGQRATAAKQANNQAIEAFFSIIQRGGSEQDAAQQAQAVYTSQLQASGLPQQQFNINNVPIGGAEGDDGELIQTGGDGGVIPAGGDGGGLIPTGGDGGVMPVARSTVAPPPGDALTPEEENQPQTALPAQPVPDNYNWLRAYQYTALRVPKINPATSDFVLDYRPGQQGRPIENIPRTKVAERRAKAGASNVEVGDFGKPAKNKLEDDLLNTHKAKLRLENIKASYDPSFSTISKRLESYISAGKEKIGFKLSPEDTAALAKISKWKRRTLANLSLTIKEITGAAMTDGEAKRIMATMPNVDDSYTEFQSKTDDVLEEIQANLEAFDEALKGGPSSLTGNPEGKPASKQPPKQQQPKATGKSGIDLNGLK